MRFVQFDEVAKRLRGKTVAIVGSAPSCLGNAPGFVDAHQVVVRVNNYRTGQGPGFRADVHYSFYGSSIRKTADELERDGVTLCACKCPNSKPIESEWHERTRKVNGIDFQYIYRARALWWFVDTFVPDNARYLEKFEALGRHVPTTGFAAILDVLACEPRNVFLTGFDFFSSGLHNVDERWRPGDPQDPIGHRPDLESEWIARNASRAPLAFDAKLSELIKKRGAA